MAQQGQTAKRICAIGARKLGFAMVCADDDGAEEVGDVGEAVAAVFGEQGQELLERAVTRALLGTGNARIIARAVQPIEPARPAARQLIYPSARPLAGLRVKYLLDGDGGPRQKTDRTAKLQRSIRGKGLCSQR